MGSTEQQASNWCSQWVNELNKPTKAASVSIFDFSALYWRESKYTTGDSYGARWVKNIKDNVICLSKQQIKDSVAYFFFNCFFTVSTKIFYQIIVIPMGSYLSFFC